MESSSVRAAMLRVQEDVEDLRRAGTGGDGQRIAHLESDWNDLVELIGPLADPLTRACPSCGRMGMPNATRCGYCWATLEPQGSAAAPPRAGDRRGGPAEGSALAAFEDEGGRLGSSQ
jgi:hypothetical protein